MNKKSLNTTYILLVVLLVMASVLGGYYVMKDEGMDKTFLSNFKKAEVAKFEINEGTDSVIIEKIDGEWYLTKPEKYRANQEYVESVLQNTEELNVLRLVSQNQNNRMKYGFDFNALKVFFYDLNGRVLSQMEIGKSEGLNSYAKSFDSENIYLVQGFLNSLYLNNPFAFKDKTILDLTDDIVDLEVNGIKGIEELEGFEELKSYFVSLEAVGFPMIAEEVDTGLEKPKYVISFKSGDDNYVLRIGNPETEEGVKYYFEMEGRDEVLLIGQEIVEELNSMFTV